MTRHTLLGDQKWDRSPSYGEYSVLNRLKVLPGVPGPGLALQ